MRRDTSRCSRRLSGGQRSGSFALRGDLLCPRRQSRQNATGGHARADYGSAYAPPRSARPWPPDPITEERIPKLLWSNPARISGWPRLCAGPEALVQERLESFERFQKRAWCRLAVAAGRRDRTDQAPVRSAQRFQRDGREAAAGREGRIVRPSCAGHRSRQLVEGPRRYP